MRDNYIMEPEKDHRILFVLTDEEVKRLAEMLKLSQSKNATYWVGRKSFKETFPIYADYMKSVEGEFVIIQGTEIGFVIIGGINENDPKTVIPILFSLVGFSTGPLKEHVV